MARDGRSPILNGFLVRLYGLLHFVSGVIDVRRTENRKEEGSVAW
jgi:hypothetical protein